MLDVIGREAIDLLLPELRLRSKDGMHLTRAIREISNIRLSFCHYLSRSRTASWASISALMT
jgi:hypothetical protein